MMTKSNLSTLSLIHDLLSEDMKVRLQRAKESGEPLSHGEWNAIAKFLKDNGFDGIPTENNPLGKLGQAAQGIDLPEFDDFDEHPIN